MCGHHNRVEINGQMFEYEGDMPVQEVKISSRSTIRRKSTITYKIFDDELDDLKENLDLAND